MERSQTPQCRWLWLMLIGIATIFTLISLYHAIGGFFSETSHVVIAHKSGDGMLYPPLKICFFEWMMFINWTLVQQLNFTKPELFFAMSFLMNVHSEQYFDVNATEKSFYRKMLLNNFTLLEQFYSGVTFKNKKLIANLPANNESTAKYDLVIEKMKYHPHQPDHYMFCYRISEKEMKKSVNQMNREKQALQSITIDGYVVKLNLSSMQASKNEILMGLTQKEYELNKGDVSGLNINLSWVVYPDAYSGQAVVQRYPGIVRKNVFITMGLSVKSWKSSRAMPCVQGTQWIASNRTCPERCALNFDVKLKRGKWYYVETKKGRTRGNWSRQVVTLITNRIHFINTANFSLSNDTIGQQVPDEFDNPTIKDEYEKCINNCKLLIGCEVWSYSLNEEQMLLTGETADITIFYPSNIAVWTEEDLQTWENFVGNIGGLLGIWSGASVLTAFQIVYLCCYYRKSDSEP